MVKSSSAVRFAVWNTVVPRNAGGESFAGPACKRVPQARSPGARFAGVKIRPGLQDCPLKSPKVFVPALFAVRPGIVDTSRILSPRLKASERLSGITSAIASWTRALGGTRHEQHAV